MAFVQNHKFFNLPPGCMSNENFKQCTPRKINIAPQKCWLEMVGTRSFLCEMAPLHGIFMNFWWCKRPDKPQWPSTTFRVGYISCILCQNLSNPALHAISQPKRSWRFFRKQKLAHWRQKPGTLTVVFFWIYSKSLPLHCSSILPSIISCKKNPAYRGHSIYRGSRVQRSVTFGRPLWKSLPFIICYWLLVEYGTNSHRARVLDASTLVRTRSGHQKCRTKKTSPREGMSSCCLLNH